MSGEEGVEKRSGGEQRSPQARVRLLCLPHKNGMAGTR